MNLAMQDWPFHFHIPLCPAQKSLEGRTGSLPRSSQSKFTIKKNYAEGLWAGLCAYSTPIRGHKAPCSKDPPLRGDPEPEGVLGTVRSMVTVDLIRVLNNGVHDSFTVSASAN